MGAGERGTRVELGFVGFGERVRTKLRGRQESEEGGEGERGKIRPTEVVIAALGRGSVCAHCRKEKDDSLVVRTVTRGHTTPVTSAARVCIPTMFSRLPSKLSAPFGILGDEPKLAFRSQPGGIAKLASTRARNLCSIPFPN